MSSQVQWPDGLERGPDGKCRQIPQKHVWSSSAWITRDGSARRRFYNPISEAWTWSDEPLQATMDFATGRMGFFLDHWISVERAIALAWLHRAPGGGCTLYDDVDIVLVGAESKAPTLSIAWKDGEAAERAAPIEGERWRALKWRCGLAPCPAGYHISTEGRLRSPQGRVTRGLWFGGDRYAAVRGAGLVNLTVAAGLRPNDVGLTPALYTTADALMTGMDAEDVAGALDVKVTTAWSYLCRAASFLQASELRKRVPRLVSRDLWSILVSMERERDAVLGASLTELRAAVERRLSARGEFRRSEYPYEELRLSRLAILA